MSGQILFVHVNNWASVAAPDTIPISQAYCLAFLRRHGFDGRILGDYQDRPLEAARFRATVAELAPSLIGFSVYEENIHRVRVWARYAKKLLPSAKIVLGGPQITFMPATALTEMAEVDILCRGEGEPVLLDLARAVAAGQDLAEVAGICFRGRDGQSVESGPAEPVADLDQLPSPYLENLVDLSGKSRVMLLSSRGCTSPCTFCYTTRASGRRIRYHSVARVVDELKHLRRQGITDFWFADPNFAHNRKRLVAMLERIIAEAPGVTFWCQTRYHLIDDQLLALLKKAGAHTIAFGLESAAPEVLRAIKKGLDPEHLARVIGQVQAAGIAVELFSLFGLPGETVARGHETLDFVKANRVAIEGNSIGQQLHLFHGTPIASAPEEHGVRPLPMTRPGYLAVCRDFETESMTRAEIRALALHWRLNRTDFAEQVESGRKLFEVAGFITANRQELALRPEADLLLARIYVALEEYEAAARCRRRLAENFPSRSEVRAFLAAPATCFKARRRGVAAPGAKVIYDCRATVDGQPVKACEAYYQDAVLGRSGLLADFEAGLLGLRAGRVAQCEVRFPVDYGNGELAGRVGCFQIYLHQVLEPVEVPAAALDAGSGPRNIYRFNELDGLREQNDLLYYLALRDYTARGLTQDMVHFLGLLAFSLQLGFADAAGRLLALLPADGSLHGHAGRIFLANNRPEQALALLEQVANSVEEVAVNRIKALLKLDRLDEADRVAAAPWLDDEIRILDLRVGLAALRQLPLAEYLRRMELLLDAQVGILAAGGGA